MNRLSPWEIDPELTKERLETIANIIKEVRDTTAELHEPEEGDGAWSLGCRIYERTINILQGITTDLSWLTCQRDNLFFLLMIGGVPLRFYHGDIDSPTKRTLKKSFQELHFEQLHLGLSDEEYRWRICVETDTDGSTLRILVAQFSEDGDSLNRWEIATRNSITPIALFRNDLPQAASIPPPSVGDKEATRPGEAVNE